MQSKPSTERAGFNRATLRLQQAEGLNSSENTFCAAPIRCSTRQRPSPSYRPKPLLHGVFTQLRRAGLPVAIEQRLAEMANDAVMAFINGADRASEEASEQAARGPRINRRE